MKRKASTWPVLLLILTGLWSGSTPTMAQDFKVAFNKRIEMPDGVELSATVWRPADQDTPLPAVVLFTPYISDAAQEHAKTFVKADFVYVSADVRGRGNSEGAFRPLEETGKDGRRPFNG